MYRLINVRLLSDTYPKIPVSREDQSKILNFKTRDNIYALDFTVEKGEILKEFVADLLLKNIFLALKSYFIEKDLLIAYVFVIFEHSDVSSGEFKKLNQLKELKLFLSQNWDYYQFEDWFLNNLEKDWEYVKMHKFYGFRIWFSPQDAHWQEKRVYPIYPWISEFEEIFYIKKIEKEQFLYKKERDLARREKLLVRLKQNAKKRKIKRGTAPFFQK